MCDYIVSMSSCLYLEAGVHMRGYKQYDACSYTRCAAPYLTWALQARWPLVGRASLVAAGFSRWWAATSVAYKGWATTAR